MLVSGQKYLGSPTAGLVAGTWPLVQAVRAQEKGIGRVMKPTKEAIIGVIAALEEWQAIDRMKWEADELAKVLAFAEAAARIPEVSAEVVPDPTGLQVSRVLLKVNGRQAGRDRTRGRRAADLRDDRPGRRRRA